MTWRPRRRVPRPVLTGVAVLTALAAIAGSPPDDGPGGPRRVSGLVLHGGRPIAGATLRIQATDVSTTTGPSGRFVIELPPGTSSANLTAWAEGHYNAGPVAVSAGDDGIEIALERHVAVDHPDYCWLPAEGDTDGACAECHSDPDLPIGRMLPLEQWRADAHSQSALNPRFLTLYEGSDIHGRRSDPTRFVDVRDYGRQPLRPTAAERAFGPGYRLDFPDTAGSCAACHAPVAAVEQPLTTDPREASGVGAEGINCDFCHKIWAVRLDSETGLPDPDMPGILSYELRRPAPGHQLFLGPFDDVAGEDSRSDLYRESAYCAGCHFGVFWDVVVYNSFGEWLASPYSDPADGKTCQDCHMPSTGATRFARADRGGLRREPTDIASHRMPGAADSHLLQNAVGMEVDVERFGPRAVVRIAVTNDQTGHHVPTGSPLRHVILLVRAQTADGGPARLVRGPVLQSWTGVGAASRGRLAGLPGKVYAKVLRDGWTGEEPTAAYWNPTVVVSDTRIAAFATDRSSFVFEADAALPIEVEASLIFRRAFIDLMEQKGWDTPDIVMERTTIVAGAVDQGGIPTR